MEIYLINLDRRRDRLEASAKQLDKAGLSYTRVSAVDKDRALDLAPYLADAIAENQKLTKSELACTLSHVKCWRKFIASGASACLILEDDLVMAPDLADFLRNAESLPESYDVLRLETYLRPVALSKRPRSRLGQYSVHAMHSTQWGAAAYVLSRSFAFKLLALEKLPALPVDDLLFNATSPVFSVSGTFQVVPAPCAQGDRLSPLSQSALYKSDIGQERKLRFAACKHSAGSSKSILPPYKKVKREAQRIFSHFLTGSGVKAFREQLRGRSWGTIPFSGEQTHVYSATAVSLRSDQQALQPQVPALRFLDAA